MKRYVLAVFNVFFLLRIINAQTTTNTYSIDFGYKTLSTTACNVFATNVTVDNYVHQTTIGFPTFTGNPDYWVNLPCKRNSQSSENGTEYQILFPFKQGNTYHIAVQYKGVVAGVSELYPRVALGLNETKKAQNSSTTCSGLQSISPAGYWGYGASGPSLAWATLINSVTVTRDYESLSIASLPWPDVHPTGTQRIQVRKIIITETVPVIAPPVTGFEGKFYRNTVNGQIFVGMRGMYRQLIGDNLYLSFDATNINFVDVNTGPSPSLIGETLAPSLGWLYGGEPTELSTLFIIDEWNDKKYFVEARRNTYPPAVNTIEFHCTEITDVSTFNKYQFKIDPAHLNVYNFNSVNGFQVLFDGALHSMGGGASAYFIQSPALP